MNVDFLLFKDFETLDAMGPAEVFGEVKEYGMRFFSPDGGITKSVHGVPIATEKFGGADHAGILMIPGGFGVRALMKSPEFLEVLGRATPSYEWVLTVCTGSALLAATGLLDGREATSNKMVFDWVSSTAPNVRWKKRARWVVDDKFYTSSGVTAGIDMALSFVSDRFGAERGGDIAAYIEYVRNEDSGNDPFAW